MPKKDAEDSQASDLSADLLAVLDRLTALEKKYESVVADLEKLREQSKKFRT